MTTNSWKRLHASAAILFVLVLFPGLCGAQTDKSPTKPLTLEAALQYALQHYPAVRASLEQVSAARAGVTLARTQYLPQLNGVYQVSRATQNQVDGIWLPTPITPSVEGPISPSSGQSYWGSQAMALLSWEPLDFGLRSAKVGQARICGRKVASRTCVDTAPGCGSGRELLSACHGEPGNSRPRRRPTLSAGRCSINPFMCWLTTSCGLGQMLRARMRNWRARKLTCIKPSRPSAWPSTLSHLLLEQQGRKSSWIEDRC